MLPPLADQLSNYEVPAHLVEEVGQLERRRHELEDRVEELESRAEQAVAAIFPGLSAERVVAVLGPVLERHYCHVVIDPELGASLPSV